MTAWANRMTGWSRSYERYTDKGRGKGVKGLGNGKVVMFSSLRCRIWAVAIYMGISQP